MNIHSRTLFFLFLVSLPIIGFAQSIKVLGIPEKYRMPAENTNTGKSSKTFLKEPWMVFSDRDDNLTYSSSGSGAALKTISFMEEFFVVGETEDQVHIVKASTSDLNLSTLELRSNVDCGWINKNRLLLWNHCLVTEKAGMTKKAMVLNTIEWAKDVQEGDNTEILKFYKKPGLTAESGNKSQLFQIYYVYKKSEDGNSLLLGKTTVVEDKRNAVSVVVGWAPKKRLIFWDHRVAIEPNWLLGAFAERKSKGIKASIYRDATEAAKYNKSNSANEQNALWDADPYEKRSIGEYRRFPLLTLDNKTNLVKSGVWGSPFTKSGDSIDLGVQASIERKINNMIERRRSINIVFVVDGTTSMLPYFHPMALAITESIKKLGQSKNNIKFGAVVYRDISEGKYLTEKITLTSRSEDVVSWLDNVFSGIKNMNDIDAPEAVFFGLKDALRNINLPDNETNYLVLVGDAGNHTRNDDSQVPREMIVDLMMAKNANFFSFQVNNKGGKDYESFVSQSKDLMLSTAFKIWKNNESVFKMMGASMPPELKSTSTGVFELTGSPITGKIVYSAPGKSIGAYAFQSQVAAFIAKSENDVNTTIDFLNKLLEGGGLGILQDEDVSKQTFDESFKPILINILAQSGISQAQLSILRKSRYQFYTTGYTSKQPDNLENPVFQTVLFITRMELGGIISDMSRLVNKRTGADARRQMYTTWLRILEEHLGESFSNELSGKSMEEITDILFGLPTKSKFLDEISLGDILDPLKFPDDKLTAWMSEIDQKLRVLRNIQNTDNYPYSFTSNDEIYYWIIQSNLP